MVAGYFYHRVQELAVSPESGGRQRTAVLLMVIGAYGLFAMFYVAGAYSMPRRYAVYPAELAFGTRYAAAGAAFAATFLLGTLVYLAETGKRWLRASRSMS